MNTMNDQNLKVAAEEGDIKLLYTLIQENPYILEHIDSIPFVETPLHVAAYLGHLRFATEIMRLKPSYAWKLNQQGFSPLHLSLLHNKKKMALRLVDINKNLVRVKGMEGLTPLHFVTQMGETDLLANFVFACPDSIEDVTVRGESALHIAVKCKQYEALEVLVGWLKTTRQKQARELENIILNWKDEEGNTILHISALSNDSRALQLLVKTKINLNAKNSEDSTAVDMAATSEIKSILFNAGAKPGSKVTDATTLEHKLRSNVTFMDKILIHILRIRRDLSEEQRNAFLIVATLIATATYQSALSPPGGVYQGNAGDNIITNSSNSTTIQEIVGKSVMSESSFFTLSVLNTLSLMLSTMTIYILTPSGLVGGLLFTPIFWFAFCYVYNMMVISPTTATSTFNLIILQVFDFFHFLIYGTFFILYKRRKGYAENKEIKIRNSIRRNKW